METSVPLWAHGGTLLKLVHHWFLADDFAYKNKGQGWNGKGVAIERALAAAGWTLRLTLNAVRSGATRITRPVLSSTQVSPAPWVEPQTGGVP